jgi:hypothetical protein
MKILYAFLLLCYFSTPALADETLLTQALDGTNITYTYSGGRSYHLKFEPEGISYRYLTGSKPDKWWGPFPYKAMVTAQGEFLVAWFEQGYGDYITLLINLEAELLYGSGIIKGSSTHFEKAHISQIRR